MIPERPEFWGVSEWGPLVVYTLMTLATVYMLVRFYQEASLWWRVGRNERRWDQPLRRLWRAGYYGILQIKVLRQSYPGIMHFAIAGSMFIFFAGTAMGTINGHFFRFLQGNVFLAYKLVLDLSVIVFLVGAGMAAYRRFVLRPDRLTLTRNFTTTLVLLTCIVLLGVLVESVRLAIERPPWAGWSPVGWGVAQLWIGSGLSEGTLHGWHQGFYLVHLIAVAGLFVTFPTGTLLHVLTAPLNIFFSKLDTPTGKLAPVWQDKEGELLYADRLQHLTWKQLLDGDACTECGRCQDACPAYASGLLLSPKQLILSLRGAVHEEGGKVVLDKDEAKKLVGERIVDEVLWACTTCGACVQECPVLIEHVDLIVDMRRYLVIEGRVDAMLQDALAKLDRYGNSFGQSERNRAKWAQTIQPPIPDARKVAVEYVWFVGDYASYNPLLAPITRQTAEIFRLAGLDFGILYEGERNAGNDVRRVGEEGLFEVLVDKNCSALVKADFKAIITTDPHSYNTLKNEYPLEMITQRPVWHYTQVIDRLMAEGRLKVAKKLNDVVTYHDPCYLGRYNGVYDAPRRILAALGCTLVEMHRNRDHTFCCSAGGGRIWMEEGEVKERPSENRIREAAALANVSVFVVACPKDYTMYTDAVKTTSLDSRLVVRDLIELVYEAVKEDTIEAVPSLEKGAIL